MRTPHLQTEWGWPLLVAWVTLLNVASGIAYYCKLPPWPEIVVDDALVVVGSSDQPASARFAVRLGPPVRHLVTVDFATEDQSAKAAIDYEPTKGRLMFRPGEALHVIEVPVSGGVFDGSKRTFGLQLEHVSRAIVIHGTGQGTIVRPLLPTATIVGPTTITIEPGHPPPIVPGDEPPKPLPSIPAIVRLEEDSVTVSPDIGQTADAHLRLRLVSGTEFPMLVRYTTEDETAKAAADYQERKGELKFTDEIRQHDLRFAVHPITAGSQPKRFCVKFECIGKGTVETPRGEIVIVAPDKLPGKLLVVLILTSDAADTRDPLYREISAIQQKHRGNCLPHSEELVLPRRGDAWHAVRRHGRHIPGTCSRECSLAGGGCRAEGAVGGRQLPN